MKKNKNKKAFTLIELLAVIVILAVILVIAVPRILEVIRASRINSMISSVKLIAGNAEKKKIENEALNDSGMITCRNVAKLGDDYGGCSISFNDGVATVKLRGKNGGKFDKLVCTGDKSDVTCEEKEPKNCTYDNGKDPEQGDEYIDGQYVYRYKEHNTYDNVNWASFSVEGWGVSLTDEAKSDNIINTELCTTINDKPIVSMSCMFLNSVATSIDLSSFDTSKVYNMSSMFRESQVTTLDLSNFDTRNTHYIQTMFYNSKVKELDLRSFDTSNLINITNMFWNSQATIGYAGTPADADRFNSQETNRPSGLTFVVKN